MTSFLCPPSILLPHNQARRTAGNTASTSIIEAVQKRTKGFYRSYFMKSSWRDTDGRRDKRKRVLEGVAHEERRLSGQGRRKKWDGMRCYREERERAEKKRETEDERVGGGGGGVQFMTEGSYLL